MLLKEYLKIKDLTQVEFAALVGVSKHLVNKMVHGKRTPSFRLSKRIFKVTQGKVTPDDFLTEDDLHEQ